jgi:hypothetical protein
MSTLLKDGTNTAMSGVESNNSMLLVNHAVKKRPPVLKKLVYRHNHPDFNQVVKEQKLKKTSVNKSLSSDKSPLILL